MKIPQRRSACYRKATPSNTRHIRRLVAEETARRSTRVRRRATRGQTLLIFALTFTVLIGFIGLAIDTVRIYDQYARMQRAAEAGALAGVIYMPTNYTTNLTTAPGDNAVCRALQEVFKNSFGPGCTAGTSAGSNYCPTPVTSTEIAVCNDPTSVHNLAVTITEPIDVLFLGALNVSPLQLSVTAVATYLPPVQVASDPTGTGGVGSWGTFGECGNSGTSASAACTGAGSRNWAGNINGPGELKEQGDPLVTCEEGPSGPLTSVSDVPHTTAPLPYTTYVGMPTNHPQNGLTVGAAPTGCTNPDTSAVFTGPSGVGLPNHAGYAFYVNMEKATLPASVWVWNAPFNPTLPSSCNGRQSTGQTTYDIFYEFNCSGSTSSPYPYYPGTSCSGQDPYACALTDPRMLFSVTYSIYQVDLANPTAGTLKATFQAFPLMTGSCGNKSYMLEASSAFGTTAGCVSSACVANWCPLGQELGGVPSTSTSLWNSFPLQPGLDYRVMVVASDY
ncbi:MAG: hypothetical protein KGO05_05585, partial [Chloroflexota bacterium]|nr:hypothetical protein [Chloroflexota bacterium]